VRAYPYLPTLRQSVLSAVPRPKSPRYDQVSLAVQAVAQDVMALRQTPEQAAARLARELGRLSRRG
ncbi:ABC transporter substrate-binding protein, partial [Streptomyces sp. NPDC059389]